MRANTVDTTIDIPLDTTNIWTVQHALLATDWSAHSPAVLPPRDPSINDLDGQIDMPPFPGPLESVVRTVPTRAAATNAVNLMMTQDDDDHDLPVEELYDAIASDDDDEHQPTMCAFEMERQRNIDQNNAMLHSLGLDVHQTMPPAKRASMLVNDSDYEYVRLTTACEWGLRSGDVSSIPPIPTHPRIRDIQGYARAGR